MESQNLCFDFPVLFTRRIMEGKAIAAHFKVDNQFTEIFSSGDYECFAACGGTEEKNVAVSLSHDHDRKPANEPFSAEMDTIWEDRRKECPKLYNGSKFRLHGVRYEEGKALTLLLGRTCYKDFVCTNMYNQSWDFLSDIGKREYDNQHACFSDALGVGAIVESSDNKMVFIRRSDQVYEAPGEIDTPGGHAEPSEVKHPGKDTDSPIDTEDMDEKAVVFEVFHSIVREVRDEINIPEDCLSWPLLIGIFRNHTTGHRPGMCFWIRCSLKGEDIRQLYNKGGLEAFESSELLLVDSAEFKKGSRSPQVKELYKDLTPGCKACLYFYLHMHA